MQFQLPRRAPVPLTLFSLWLAAGVVGAAAGAEPGPAGTLFRGRDATLSYEIKGGGAGTPLIAVNGGPGVDHSYLLSSGAWSELSKGRPVVLYDQRGTGRSPALRKGQSCTLADQIEDLDALRAHLGYAQVDLFGHSWGGYLAMAYAARHPDRVRRLIICDSAAPKIGDTVFLFKDVFPETNARQDALEFANQLGDSVATRNSFLEYLSMLFYDPQKRDAYMAKTIPTFNREVRNYDKRVNEAVWNDVQRFDLNPELPKLAMPTLVITGRFDMNVAPSVAWKIHRAIPGSRFVVFERSGHMPFYEEPDVFVKTMEEFLAPSGARRN
jgi:proline iminopeptidase